MFLVFTMGRTDVFSVGDLGLRTAMSKLYGITENEEMVDYAESTWSPYRSIASWYLWRSLDNE
jgi:DNA-3-methyladenine glycosylase II